MRTESGRALESARGTARLAPQRAGATLVHGLTLGGLLLAAPAWGQPEWGGDHVGRPIPDYVDGEVCLFCHRDDIGTSWQGNSHARTVRTDGDSYLLGAGDTPRRMRLLRAGRFGIERGGKIDASRFTKRCAGCHASGFDSRTGLFFSIGIDCFACPGDAPLKHSNDVSLVQLSRSTGLPFANNYVAGDNLLLDFAAAFDEESLQALPWGERHIFENARSVLLGAEERTTCIRCHRIHGDGFVRHRRIARADLCYTCHEPARRLAAPAEYERHNALCEY